MGLGISSGSQRLSCIFFRSSSVTSAHVALSETKPFSTNSLARGACGFGTCEWGASQLTS
eukprot:7967804-Karenia_brevis.AAC.1